MPQANLHTRRDGSLKIVAPGADTSHIGQGGDKGPDEG